MNDDTLNGLSDGTYRAWWLREVLRTSLITESVKVLLISMALEEMDAAGRVSVPRELLAVRIGRGKARVSERLQEAVDKGFLVRVSAGKKGSTAVYAAAFKGSACPDRIEGGETASLGPHSRTESEEKGSGLQDAEQNGNGPAMRTRTFFGSDLQDAKDDETVREAGPNAPEKGPLNRDANVVGGVGEVDSLNDSANDDFLKAEDAASRQTSQKLSRTKRATAIKIPLPADFAPDDAMRAWARDKCPLVDIDAQTDAFIVHFTPEPGEQPEKRPGWSRSWKAWMVRQQGWVKDRQSNVHQLRPTGTGGPYQPYRNPADQSVYNEDL